MQIYIPSEISWRAFLNMHSVSFETHLEGCKSELLFINLRSLGEIFVNQG